MDFRDGKQMHHIHYKGWKDKWNEWVGLDYPNEIITAVGGVYITYTTFRDLVPLLLLSSTFTLCRMLRRGLINAHKAVNLLKHLRSQDCHRHKPPGFAPPVIPGTGGGTE